MTVRCEWAGPDPLYIEYHDSEWGVPQHDDRRLFELLILEGAQAGLNWLTILKKRNNYVKAFDSFDPEIIAKYDDAKIAGLLSDPGIVRNRLKIRAAVQNAIATLSIRKEYENFDNYIWSFVGGRPKKNAWKSLNELPARSVESEAMSRALAVRGFKFVGPTICYAFMQATGMLNDHIVGCFRYNAIS